MKYKAKLVKPSKQKVDKLSLIFAQLICAMVIISPNAFAEEVLAKVKKYEIPAGPLENALNQFARSSGVVLSFPPATTQGKETKGLKGNFTIKEGFKELLKGTGLEIVDDQHGGYFLDKALPTASDKAKIPALGEKDIKLDTIDVRAKRLYEVGPIRGLALTKEEIPGNVQSISAKEIKASKALSLTDLMNSKLQSVNVNDYQSNPFQMDVTYRGFTASPQLGTAQGLSVFLDGIRVNEPFGDVVNWDMIPLNALSSLDVFPGSNPLFGLGTLGGALSMKTKSGFDTNEGTVEALGGSFNRKQFQGSIGGNNGVVAGFVAANIFREDGWRDNSPSEVNQIFGKAEWRNEKLQLGLSMLYAGNKLVGNGLLPTELAKQDSSQIFTSPDETKNRLLQFQLSGIWDVSDTFNISAQVYKRKSRRNSSTGDVNQNFGGAASRRPLPGEVAAAAAFVDANGDGIPDIDPNGISLANAALDQNGFYLDTNGNAQFTGNIIQAPALDEFGNPILDEFGNPILIDLPEPNPAFTGNLAVGTNINTPVLAGQGVEDILDDQGNVIGSRPSWGTNPNAVWNPSEDFKRRALLLFQSRDNGSESFKILSQQLFPAGGFEQFILDTGLPTASYLTEGGFLFTANLLKLAGADKDANGNPIIGRFKESNSPGGLGQPFGIILRDASGAVIERDGADCQPSPGTCSGFVDGTPTALITETDLDQTTDGATLQFNWNLEQHKFMLGASIDASDASYQSGQRLGLLDNKRNVFLDPNQLGYEFAAASNKLGLNDFAGESSTKSLFFSETWTPKKEWAFTAAGRYNITHVKNELAINNFLGLIGPTAFKNFLQPIVLCQDLNADGNVTLDECPSATIIPFSIERANNIGQIGKGETEKFTYRSFNPSLGATWQPTETLNLYGNWNRGARTPSVIELGCAFDDSPRQIGVDPITGAPTFGPRSLVEQRFCSLPSTLAGDPYLKQVRSETLEFGGRGYLTPDIQWNAAVYNTDLTDDIYFVSFAPERSFFQNIGNTRRRGLEMGLQGKQGKLGFRLNYSLTDATFQDKFKMASPNNTTAGNVNQRLIPNASFVSNGFQNIEVNPGDRMPGVPLHNLNATLSYDLTPDWTVGLTGILHSESFIRGNENNKHRAGISNAEYACQVTGGAASSVVNGIEYGCSPDLLAISRKSRFPGKVPGYAVFNFNTSYKITKGLTAGLLINNLFDREYYSAGRLGVNPFVAGQFGVQGPGGFNYNSNDWLSSTFLAPGAPRSAFFTMTYDFDMGK